MARSITVGRCWQAKGMVPMIRLRGQWLAAAGFKEGTRLRVVLAGGALVLVPEDIRAQRLEKREREGSLRE